MNADVIIVGGGISGLVAAYRIQNKENLKVVVLEEQDHVGGRIISRKIPINETNSSSDIFDMGGQWINPEQTHIMKLIKELQIQTHPQYHSSGRHVYEHHGGSLLVYGGQLPLCGWLACIDLKIFVWRIGRLCSSMDITNPYGCRVLPGMMGMTVEKLLLEYLWTIEAFEFVQTLLRNHFGCEIKELCALYFLIYVSSMGGFKELLPYHAKLMTIQGGAHIICDELARRIHCVNIKVSTMVTSIEEKEDSVTITTESGKIYRSGYVIVSVPPQQLLKLNIIPSLTPEHENLLKYIPTGCFNKFILTTKESTWRRLGYSGLVLSSGGRSHIPQCDKAPIGVCFDTATANRNPAIGGYFVGMQALQWNLRTASERKEAVLRSLCRYFGKPIKFVSYAEQFWPANETECPINYEETFPGDTFSLRPIRKPLGRLFWCGSETATCWMGHMEGAVQSGERAALEVLYMLRPQMLSVQEFELLPKTSDRIDRSTVSKSSHHVIRWTIFIPLITLATICGVYTLRQRYLIVGTGCIV